MPFVYSSKPHSRRHGPHGYLDYKSYKPWLRDEFCFRCVYCLERERWYPSGHDAFGVDHVKPKGRAEYMSLVCNYEYLVYACNQCNAKKGDSMLIDPCTFTFSEHLDVDDEGSIEGLGKEGRRLIKMLCLDSNKRTRVRRYYLRILELHHNYPDDSAVEEMYCDAFGFPEDLPDVVKLRPRGNNRPLGIKKAYHAQTGLPKVYLG